jgi:DNA polymerase-1
MVKKQSNGKLLPLASKGPVIIDTETTGLNKMMDVPYMITYKVGDNIETLEWNASVAKWLAIEGKRADLLVFHNAKFDMHMCINGGVPAEAVRQWKVWCTWIAEVLIDEHLKSYKLRSLSERHFGKGKEDEELIEWIVNNVPQCKKRSDAEAYMEFAPRSLVKSRNQRDVILTEMLYNRQVKEVLDQDLISIADLEMEVIHAIVNMERTGCPVNVSAIEQAREEIELDLLNVMDQMQGIVGYAFNVNSPVQVGKALRESGVDVILSEAGNPVTNKETLRELSGDLPPLILEARHLRKMIENFLDGMLSCVSPDGRIHCDFNQMRSDDYGTKTGRLSASNPNMQQVPKRDERSAEIIRSLFAPKDGYDWINSDWEQFEFRIFAHYCNDPSLLQQYKDKPEIDFHQAVADLTGVARNPYAKQINLGLVFGMGEGRLAQELKLPYKIVKKEDGSSYAEAGPEAKALFKTYHKNFPYAQQFLKRASRLAFSRGYIKTLLGRRIRFPYGQSTHKAGGLVFQGSAADLMKRALVQIDKMLYKEDCGAQLCLTIHDEFDLISPHDQTKKIKKKIVEIMQDVPELHVPILASCGSGENWWSAMKGEK